VDRQCSSCGGFCKKSGCERENIKPKEWVGLSEADIYELMDNEDEFEYAYAIEAKLKEKNT
jgi:hypothetical protein